MAECVGGRYCIDVSHQIEHQQDKYNKIHGGLRWSAIDNNTPNNQPKIGGRDGGEYTGEV